MDKCPGMDGRFITADDITCPSCGATVELFSDEQKRRCPTCGTRVTRVAAPACVSWCAAARDCIGPARYDKLREEGMLEDVSSVPAEEGAREES